MIVEEKVALSRFVTLKTGGPAEFLVHAQTLEDIVEAIAFAKEKNLPWVVLGEGSNVLPLDEGYSGVVIRVELQGLTIKTENNSVLVRAGAGVSWDAVVARAEEEGWWGIENLAAIPGTVGAAAVQNIGAYGREFSEVCKEVEAYDTKTQTQVTLSRGSCRFAYRDSLFKQESRYIVVSVTFELSLDAHPVLHYPDLNRTKEEGAVLSTPSDIASAVRTIRSRKFPDLQTSGTAGSFFKNPVVSKEKYQALKEGLPELPGYPNEEGIKIPLAYLLDRGLHLKGHSIGTARLFEAQPLVLVLEPYAPARDVELLAQEIEKKIRDTYNIQIEREVVTLRAN